MPSTTLEETKGQSGLESAVPSDQLRKVVEEEFQKTRIIDMHTHLFMPSLGKLGLWGIDELITYHYLEAELFRFSAVKPDQYWKLSKQEQADLIWRTLFLENSPVSEATRGVVAVMNAFGFDTRAKDLTEARQFFNSQKIESHIPKVFELAGISAVVMTNDPLDPQEAPLMGEQSSLGQAVSRRFAARPRAQQVG